MPPAGTGVFNDGRTAAAHLVRVVAAAERLEIRDSDDRPLAFWPYPQLRLVDRARDGTRARLACGEDDARLGLGDRDLIRALTQRAPQLAPGLRLPSRRTVSRAAIWAGAIAALAAAIWFGWPRLADGVAAVLPAAWEDAIGQRVVAGMMEERRTCDRTPGQAALDRLAARLTVAAGLRRRVAVRVVDWSMINAFAAPGGHVIILKGLIAGADSAEEVAGVLAHELGHVAAQHPTRIAVRWLGLDLIVMALTGQSDLARLGALLLGFSYSRDFEREADARAIAMLAAAGIDARGLAAFFAKLETKAGKLPKALAYVSTHPDTGERRKAAERGGAPSGPAMPAEDWSALRAICERDGGVKAD